MTPEGYIQNCHFISREGGPDALVRLPSGKLAVQLDGYTILPKEQYQALAGAFNTSSDNMLAEALVKPLKVPRNWSLYAAMVLWWAAGMVFGYITWGPT